MMGKSTYPSERSQPHSQMPWVSGVISPDKISDMELKRRMRDELAHAQAEQAWDALQDPFQLPTDLYLNFMYDTMSVPNAVATRGDNRKYGIEETQKSAPNEDSAAAFSVPTSQVYPFSPVSSYRIFWHAIENLNAHLRELKRGADEGATAVFAQRIGKQVVMANVGDSIGMVLRQVRSAEGKLYWQASRMTVEHSVARAGAAIAAIAAKQRGGELLSYYLRLKNKLLPMILSIDKATGEISLGAGKHKQVVDPAARIDELTLRPAYLNGLLTPTAGIGDFAVGEGYSHEPGISTLNLDDNLNSGETLAQSVVLLATDGLIKAGIGEREILTLLEQGVEPQALSERLVDMVGCAGGLDDVTVLVEKPVLHENEETAEKASGLESYFMVSDGHGGDFVSAEIAEHFKWLINEMRVMEKDFVEAQKQAKQKELQELQEQQKKQKSLYRCPKQDTKNLAMIEKESESEEDDSWDFSDNDGADVKASATPDRLVSSAVTDDEKSQQSDNINEKYSASLFPPAAKKLYQVPNAAACDFEIDVDTVLAQHRAEQQSLSSENKVLEDVEENNKDDERVYTPMDGLETIAEEEDEEEELKEPAYVPMGGLAMIAEEDEEEEEEDDENDERDEKTNEAHVVQNKWTDDNKENTIANGPKPGALLATLGMNTSKGATVCDGPNGLSSTDFLEDPYMTDSGNVSEADLVAKLASDDSSDDDNHKQQCEIISSSFLRAG